MQPILEQKNGSSDASMIFESSDSLTNSEDLPCNDLLENGANCDRTPTGKRVLEDFSSSPVVKKPRSSLTQSPLKESSCTSSQIPCTEPSARNGGGGSGQSENAQVLLQHGKTTVCVC